MYIMRIMSLRVSLVVRNDGKDYLVPFIKVFIKEVTKDKIVINEIEGLFWK